MPKGIFVRAVRKPLYPIGPSIAYIPLTRGQYALVDRDMASALSQQNWFAQWQPHGQCFYARRSARCADGSRFILPMHSVVAGLDGPFTQEVDHLNRNSLDNRIANLRFASRTEQNWNKRLRGDSSSGRKGVGFHRKTGKWQAAIQANGARLHLGLFVNIEDASAAYAKAAAKLHGEFAAT